MNSLSSFALFFWLIFKRLINSEKTIFLFFHMHFCSIYGVYQRVIMFLSVAL